MLDQPNNLNALDYKGLEERVTGEKVAFILLE